MAKMSASATSVFCPPLSAASDAAAPAPALNETCCRARARMASMARMAS